MWYCSKYICKRGLEQDMEPEWHRAGRWWGIFNKGAIPWAAAKAAPLSPESAHVLESVMLSVLTKRNKGRKLPEYVRPRSVFLEPGELIECATYHAGLYFERAGIPESKRAVVLARVLREISLLIPPSLEVSS
jgi:hypothetical protein